MDNRQPTVTQLRELAAQAQYATIDASVGSPVDPPPGFIPHVLASSNRERGYPRSDGSEEFRYAVADWLEKSFQVTLSPASVAATVGSKEFIATLPAILAESRPGRRYVLLPAVAYPTYAAGARFAGLETFEVPVEGGEMQIDRIPPEVASSALLLWINSPGNPTGEVVEYPAVADFCRRNGIVLGSDECYSDYFWSRPRASALECGTEGVLSVFSLSKRSNLAGLRIGAYAGDSRLVAGLVAARRELGLIPAGPVQAAAVAALGDEGHVIEQRKRYRERLEALAKVMAGYLADPQPPDGGIYLWARAAGRFEGSGDALALHLARELGIVVAPGSGFGDRRYVRVAATLSTSDIAELAVRLG